MGFFDKLKSKNASGTRIGGTTAKKSIRNSLQNQLDVLNGKKIIVASNEVKSWWTSEDKPATWKISGLTLGRTQGSKDDFKADIEKGLKDIESGSDDGNDLIKALEEAIKEREERKRKKKEKEEADAKAKEQAANQ